MAKKQKKPLTLVDYNNMVQLFHDESDRAAAVFAGSIVEGYTENLLRAIMRDEDQIGTLFNDYAPLATFSARNKIAYALALIDEALLNELECIRKIRNHFAHEPRDTSFTVSPVRDLCNNLSTKNVDPEPRIQYLMAVGLR